MKNNVNIEKVHTIDIRYKFNVYKNYNIEDYQKEFLRFIQNVFDTINYKNYKIVDVSYKLDNIPFSYIITFDICRINMKGILCVKPFDTCFYSAFKCVEVDNFRFTDLNEAYRYINKIFNLLKNCKGEEESTMIN